jgi:hypothetical protein
MGFHKSNRFVRKLGDTAKVANYGHDNEQFMIILGILLKLGICHGLNHQKQISIING